MMKNPIRNRNSSINHSRNYYDIIKSCYIISVTTFIMSIGFCQSWHPEITLRPRLLYTDQDYENIIDRLDTYPYNYLWFNTDISFYSIYKGAQETQSNVQNSWSTPRTYTDQRSKIAKDAAFVYAINKRADGISNLDSYSDQGDNPFTRDEYGNKAIEYLRSIDSEVLGPDDIVDFIQNAAYMNNWQHRAEELIYYCQAYDLLLGSEMAQDAIIESNIAALADDLLQQYSKMEEIGKIFIARNNHKLIIAGALGVAAVTLNQNNSATKWISAAMILIEWVLFHPEDYTDDGYKQTDADGGYGEGPNYMAYAFRKLIPFFIGMKHFNGDWSEEYSRAKLDEFFYPVIFQDQSMRSPYFDERYHQMYNWILKTRMPDGRLPAIDDTPLNLYFPELSILGLDYSFPIHSYQLGMSTEKAISNDLNELRADYISAGNYTSIPNNSFSRSLILTDAGTAIFRDSWNTDAIYLNMTAKNGLARLSERGHGHSDVTSFILNYKGKTIITHPGYAGWPLRYRLNKAENHNLVLVKNIVNDQYYGPVPPTGPAVTLSFPSFAFGQLFEASSTDGYLQKFYEDDFVSYVQAKSNYGQSYFRDTNKENPIFENQEVWKLNDEDSTNISFLRKVTFVQKKYFLIVDEIHDNLSEERSYISLIHLNAGYSTNGIYSQDDTGGVIEVGEAQCKLFHTALGSIDSVGIDFNFHADGNGEQYLEKHDVLKLHKSGESPIYASIIFPFNGEEPDISESSDSNYIQIIIPDNNDDSFVDVVVLTKGWDIVNIPIKNISGIPIPAIQTNAELLIFRKNIAHDEVLIFSIDGDHVIIDGVNYQETELSTLDETVNHPRIVDLKNNYPNPFNSTTSILFELTEKSIVTLKIYDILGNEIDEIVNKQLTPDFYTFRWDGRDNNNNNVSSGVYIYKIETKNDLSTMKTSISKKLILLK